MNLLLAAVEVAGPLRWRWELRDEGTGEVLAEHHVSLDAEADSDRVTAFGDLHDYVRWHADPLWDDDEPRIVRETGMWARGAVLGEAIATAITAAAPAIVLVSVPPPADQALLWPLELAFADGVPLAARGDVSFVYCLGRPGAVPAPPVSPVRVLAAFSQPTGTNVIALRRERYELAELVRRMVNRDGAAIELRVLQYGVTRQRLGEVVGSGGGWDVVHLSGHGNRAGFALERSDGSEDFTSTADLVDLLRPARGRLKLVVLSCCNSAAEAATDRLRLLGLPEERTTPGVEPAPGRVSGLARRVAQELGCAVVATRYRAHAEFLTAFNRVFYERMLSGGQPAAVASSGALAAVLGGAPAGQPAASDGTAVAVRGEPVPLGLPAVTVGVFGTSAATLVLGTVPGDQGAGETLVETLSAALLIGPDGQQACPLHPVVAAAIRRETPASVRDAADTELAAGWAEDGDRAGRALAVLPYLTRRQDWNGAAALLDRVLRHGTLPTATVDRYLSDLRQVSRFTTAPAASAALALATQPADPAEARRLLQGSLDSADSAGDYPLAWLVAGYLADALRDTGHLDQALDVVTRQEHYAQAAGLGPWTRLAGQSRRLVVLARMERHLQVLAELSDVRERMRRLTDEDTSGELPSVVPSTVRGQVLDTARYCALASGKWQAALNAGAEILDSQRRRGASRHALAITRVFDAYPLIRLRRLTEAAALLVECQQIFEDEGDAGHLSYVFADRADLEAALDHADNAVRFARSALRATYTRTIPDPIAAAHQRLAHYLRKAGAPAEEQQAHWLAAALLSRLSGRSGVADGAPPGLRDGRPLWFLPGITDLHPWTLARVIDTVEQTRGIHLAELITAIEPDDDTVTRELTAILESATGPGAPAAAVRAAGRQLFGNLVGYGLATDPRVSPLANRLRRWLGAQADQEHKPEAGSLAGRRHEDRDRHRQHEARHARRSRDALSSGERPGQSGRVAEQSAAH